MSLLLLLACAVGGDEAPAAPGSPAARANEELKAMTAAARRVTELSESIAAGAADPGLAAQRQAELAEARVQLEEAQRRFSAAEVHFQAP